MKPTRPTGSIGERIPNLAPMVDVIMVLLVFFMLGATLKLTSEGVLATELDPSSGPSQGAEVELVPIVKIRLENAGAGRGCNMYVAGQLLDQSTITGLRALLRKRRAEGADPLNPVVIGAKSDVPWSEVVATMDACVAAGFRNVQFAVSLAGKSRP